MSDGDGLKKNKGFWRTMMRKDMSSRHSMIETGSQRSLDRSSVSSVGSGSQTSGSLDRLTASAHRNKPPKSSFFRLKPKTPTFWKPLFHPSGAGSSEHLQVSLPRKDQSTQANLTPTVEFGVQAVQCATTHTRDVPVQTCPTWDYNSRSRHIIFDSRNRYTTTPIQKPDPICTPRSLFDEPHTQNETELSTSAKSCSYTSPVIEPQTAQVHEILPQPRPGLSEMAEIELDFNALPIMYGTYSNRFSSIRDTGVPNPLSKLRDDFEKLRNDFNLGDLDINELEKRTVKDFSINPNFEVLREDFSSPISPAIEKTNLTETLSDPISENRTESGEPEKNSECVPPVSSCETPQIETDDQTHSPHLSPVSEEIVDDHLDTSEIIVSATPDIDILSGDSLRFDSCQNLDELEDEIIRSLYTPVQQTDDNNAADETLEYYDNNAVDSILEVTNNATLPSPDVKTFISVTENIIEKTKVFEKHTFDNNHDPSNGQQFNNISAESGTKNPSNVEVKRLQNNMAEETPKSQASNEIDVHSEISEAFIDLPSPNQKKVFTNVLEVRRSSWSGIEPQIPSPVLEVDESNTTPDTSGRSSPVDNFIKTNQPVPKTVVDDADRCQSVEEVSNAVVSQAHIVLKPLPPSEPKQNSLSTQQSILSSETNTGNPEKNQLVTPPPPPPLPPIPNPTSTHSPTNHHINNVRSDSRSPTPNNDGQNNIKSPMVLELEQKFQNRRKIANELEQITRKIAQNIHTNGTAMPAEIKSTWIPSKDAHAERKVSNDHSPDSPINRIQHVVNGNIRNGYSDRTSSSPLRNTSSPRQPMMNGGIELSFSGQTVVTSDPPPAGAILVDEKVTVDGDKIYTDKYYTIPVKEVLKEKTSTTKFIPAPEKYEGIGPTEEGIPVSLRQSVKKENMSDWYKTMYNTLHKIDNKDDTYVIGYSSDPEIRKEDKYPPPPMHDLLGTNQMKFEKPVSPVPQVSIHKYPTKSNINVYSADPRPIEDYEPGYSSVMDRELNIGSKRYFPTNKHPKTLYEVRDGYESESSVFKKFSQPDELATEDQRMLYREVQQGGEIPQFGLRKPAPEKPKEVIVGPLPPPPNNYQPQQYPQAIRPSSLPPEYMSNGENDFGQQANGMYANQMRHAIHTELQQKGFQASPLSPNSMAVKKPIIKPPQKKLLARTLYDFVAESSKELSLKKEEIVVIHRELDKNWYEGERNGAIGIFPVTYVEILPPEHISSTPKKAQEGLAKVLFDFPAHNAIELAAKKGDEMHLIRKVDGNWYEGRIGNNKGIIPCSYISVIQEPGSEPGKYQQPMLSPSLKEVRSTPSLSPVSDISLSPHMKTNGTSALQNGQSNRMKRGNKLIEPVRYRALYRYSPQNADELQLVEGDDVYVIEMCDDGWYVGTSVRTGELGIIPGNYMEKI